MKTMCPPRLASVRVEHSVCRRSLMTTMTTTTYIHINIYIYIYNVNQTRKRRVKKD